MPVAEAPADQVYAVAPVAIRVAVSPAQIVGELTVITNNGATVTDDIAVSEHPDVVPVTV